MITATTYFEGVKRLKTLQQFIVWASGNSWALFEHKLADPVHLRLPKLSNIAAAEESYSS